MFTSVDKVLDEIMQLDYATREMLVEIISKRQIEERRKEISQNAKKSLTDYKRGKSKVYSSRELICHLHSL